MCARVLVLVVALSGCTCEGRSKPAAGSGSAQPAGGNGRAAAAAAAGSAKSAGSAAGSAGSAAGLSCTLETATRVSRILTDPAHPCRERILAAYGRMVRIGAGPGASGTIVSTAAARGAGLLVTCRPCAEVTGREPARIERGGWMADPDQEPPLAFEVSAPARLAGGAMAGGGARLPAKGLLGADDFTVAAVVGAPGEPNAAAPAAPERKLELDDPRRLAAARAPFVDVRPGAMALVLGFADAEGGELVASIGPVLDDDEARGRIARGGASEYDARAELAIAARALPGMAGGGVFDEAGRFVGVVLRASAEPAGGEPLVRAARATSIAARLSEALRAAPVPLRLKIVAFPALR